MPFSSSPIVSVNSARYFGTRRTVALAPVTEAELVAHVRSQLAAYKAPKRVVTVAKVPRAPNGKADYDGARQLFDAA